MTQQPHPSENHDPQADSSPHGLDPLPGDVASDLRILDDRLSRHLGGVPRTAPADLAARVFGASAPLLPAPAPLVITTRGPILGRIGAWAALAAAIGVTFVVALNPMNDGPSPTPVEPGPVAVVPIGPEVSDAVALTALGDALGEGPVRIEEADDLRYLIDGLNGGSLDRVGAELRYMVASLPGT